MSGQHKTTFWKDKVTGRNVAPANYQIPSPIVCDGGGGYGQPHHPVKMPPTPMLATYPIYHYSGPVRPEGGAIQ